MSSYVDTKIIALTSQSASIKFNGTFLSNLRYNLGPVLRNDKDIIHRQVHVLNAQIPVSFYVINYTNNQFTIRFGAGVYTTYTIPVGNYTANSLITAIKTVVNVVGFNIVISPINGCLTFSHTAAISIDNNGVNTIGYILGFASGIYNDTAFSIIAPFPLNLLGIKTLQVRSSNLIMDNVSSVQGGQTTLLSSIPVSATPFGMIDYKDLGNNMITVYNDYLEDLDLDIVDGESGAYINFNNQDWCITLAFHITRAVQTMEPSVKLNQGTLVGKPTVSPTTPSSIGGNAADTKSTTGALAPFASLPSEEPPKEEKTIPENPALSELNLLLEEPTQ